MQQKIRSLSILAAVPLASFVMATAVSTSNAGAAVNQTAMRAVTTATVHISTPDQGIFPECTEFNDGAYFKNPITGTIYQCTYVEGEWIWVPVACSLSGKTTYAREHSIAACG
jgi:hypothetical protein